MTRLSVVLVLVLAACSNAADPTVDAHVGPPDGASGGDATIDTPPGGTVRILALNEVAAGETPDWIEIVNATTSPVQLSDFMYVDAVGDFAKAKPFPAMMRAACSQPTFLSSTTGPKAASC